MVFLETERLALRQLRPGDEDVMFDYRNDDRCARYQRGQTKDLEGIRDLVRRHSGDQLSTEAAAMVAVADKRTGLLLGEIVVMPSDGAISLGYTISYRHHRQGIAFEALSALTEFLHGRFPEQEFISFVEPENGASMALLKKLGYQDLGYVPQLTSQAFGKWTGEDPLR